VQSILPEVADDEEEDEGFPVREVEEVLSPIEGRFCEGEEEVEEDPGREEDEEAGDEDDEDDDEE
jgi:hypothetical protein